MGCVAECKTGGGLCLRLRVSGITSYCCSGCEYWSRDSPAIVQCKVTAAFKFSSGRGAILVMENETMSIIDPPGALTRLLDDPSMRGAVVVSEVHRCASYARFLSAQEDSTITLGLRVQPPVPGIASAAATATWVRSGTSGTFKSQANKKGDRTFYPLFRLVSRGEESTAMTIGGSLRNDSSTDTSRAGLERTQEQEDQ